MILSLACSAWLACAAPTQSQGRVALEQVLAVEEADSPAGRYRFVLSFNASLPPPTSTSDWPAVWMGKTLLRYPGAPRDGRIVFAYSDELPAGEVPLRLTAFFDDERVRPGDIVVHPQALLAASRLAPGQYEPAHVERSLGPMVDLGAAWAAADGVFVGPFLRGDVVGERGNAWELTFGRESVLREPAGTPLSEQPVFVHSTPASLFELGARYVVFVGRSAAGEVVPEHLVAIRLWQPRDDYVLGYLEVLAQGEWNDPSAGGWERARRFLYEALQSPAGEVRLAAASGLHGRSALAPTRKEVDRLRELAALEPRGEVRRAMLRLAGER